ncbi:hypothetical protein DYB28_011361 [Aphanomyces astaci]|uniref:Uncharacterized protein n=1 Tax=Aphanomyces astaci TaxID=112090 RepID=A0A397AGA6_APHAT|nr:hypothetical protein DYB36_003718 [Aphanomyces astaci]RHY05324.1 hypothetical protein DYB25_002627 [Aphanomyces astaci]RHY55946.1 hypothetical protein DYB38_007050 [Aphanomyces astaci]RHY56905.1 hypothetical protein DYB34_001227 [Aphanomyces astaci]RHY57701.1 hypothetical protein DYB30_000763 [Aphanomyces astaci]
MGGEGQLHGSTLGRVCTVTFPESYGTPRVILDADYVCATGWSFFMQLFASMAPTSSAFRLCHLKDDEIRWVRDDEALLALFEDGSIRHQALHAVEEHAFMDGKVMVHSHLSPDFSPEIYGVAVAGNDEDEQDDSLDDGDDIALEDEDLPDAEVVPDVSPSTLFNSIRMFFEPKQHPPPKKPTDDNTKKNWWSASTQLFMKPFTKAEVTTPVIPDITYRHSEPPMRPLSASHRVQFPRMSYTVQAATEEATTTPRHSFHISSSWHHHADRMSASMNLPSSAKDKSMGSFVWI